MNRRSFFKTLAASFVAARTRLRVADWYSQTVTNRRLIYRSTPLGKPHLVATLIDSTELTWTDTGIEVVTSTPCPVTVAPRSLSHNIVDTRKYKDPEGTGAAAPAPPPASAAGELPEGVLGGYSYSISFVRAPGPEDPRG